MRRVALGGVLFLLSAACADPVTTPVAEGASDSLEVRCDGETTEVLTPIVQAESDGVHIAVHNSSQTELSVSTETVGQGAAPGDSGFVAPISPGSSRIRCLPVDEDHAAENGDWGVFDVLAPEGWVSPDVVCPGAGYGSVGDYAEGARGVADPLQDAPKHFREDGDEVVQAGYATDEKRTFVLLRDGEPVAGLVYISDGNGGWLQSESFGCSD
jgi:hypothetical protein